MIFYIKQQVCIQIDDVTLESLLRPILANIGHIDIFLSHYVENQINNCLAEFRPHFYRSYVDDIAVLFSLPESAYSCRDYVF